MEKYKDLKDRKIEFMIFEKAFYCLSMFFSMGNLRSLNAISSTRKSLSAEEALKRFLSHGIPNSDRHLVRGRGGAIDKSV